MQQNIAALSPSVVLIKSLCRSGTKVFRFTVHYGPYETGEELEKSVQTMADLPGKFIDNGEMRSLRIANDEGPFYIKIIWQ